MSQIKFLLSIVLPPSHSTGDTRCAILHREQNPYWDSRLAEDRWALCVPVNQMFPPPVLHQNPVVCRAKPGITIPRKQRFFRIIPVDLLCVADIQMMITHFVISFQAADNGNAAVDGDFNGAAFYLGKLNIELGIFVYCNQLLSFIDLCIRSAPLCHA